MLARPKDARALGGAVCCEHVSSAKGSRKAFGRGQSKHVECFCACVGGYVTHDRVALNMMDFDGREVGRSAKSFEVPHVSSTHRLSAKGSRDASLHVESTRVWRFCGCVRGRATPGPSNARDNLFGWASGRFIYYIYVNQHQNLYHMKIIMKLNKQMLYIYIIYI